ncbi:MAG: ATP-binding protein, partial [Hyphomicrobium sp.]
SPSMQGAMLRTPTDERADVGVHTHATAGPTGPLLVAERNEWKSPSEPPVQFIIGTDQQHLDSVVNNFNATLSWSLAGFGLTMVLAASLLILYAMRPLDQLRGALSLLRSGSAKTIPGKFPTEVQPLVDDLNSLLNSSSELIQRARTQAGNMAHGLKTPLAILTDEAYRIGEQGSAQSSATILEQCRKMQTQIDYQTTRARVVASRLSFGTSTIARDASEEVLSALARLHNDRKLQFENAITKTARVACDRQDFQEILANLADNASKHAKSIVRLTSTEPLEESTINIVIEDDGPGLPPEAYEVVFLIGERWDTHKSGSGLGLAIARDLARLYDGDITLGTSALGGLRATLSLPAAPDARPKRTASIET